MAVGVGFRVSGFLFGLLADQVADFLGQALERVPLEIVADQVAQGVLDPAVPGNAGQQVALGLGLAGRAAWRSNVTSTF